MSSPELQPGVPGLSPQSKSRAGSLGPDRGLFLGRVPRYGAAQDKVGPHIGKLALHEVRPYNGITGWLILVIYNRALTRVSTVRRRLSAAGSGA